MKLVATEIEGAFVVEVEPVSDDRGSFHRQWCARELAGHGLRADLVQVSVSINTVRGTLRGMHYQTAPHGETKLVSCQRGAIYDVLVDLRPGPTHHRWVGYELTAVNRRMLYVPEGVAHGFLTLEDASEVQYFISTYYEPASARGVRYDDPAFGIRWPGPAAVISARDAGYPDVVGAAPTDGTP
ncbi:MAG: dTDP-4-dehydrorhamnose 3,5-epimerase family protein [Deltaproteobacteria bacterium]|nr:dTDP-4-dehydrorhamnose 3,5-epimerase family protein [Deltaproteobacteria bacterium]